jgi:hypothetical protein
MPRVGPSVRTHRAPVTAHYSCLCCARSGSTCQITPGCRSCVNCFQLRRRCVTRRSSHPSDTAIRARIEVVRVQLTSILANLSSLEGSIPGEPDVSGSSNSSEPIAPDAANAVALPLGIIIFSLMWVDPSISILTFFLVLQRLLAPLMLLYRQGFRYLPQGIFRVFPLMISLLHLIPLLPLFLVLPEYLGTLLRFLFRPLIIPWLCRSWIFRCQPLTFVMVLGFQVNLLLFLRRIRTRCRRFSRVGVTLRRSVGSMILSHLLRRFSVGLPWLGFV